MNRCFKSRGLAACAAAFVVSATLTSCSSGPPETTANAEVGQSTPMRVGVGQFATLAESRDIQVVDVRTPDEFASGHIAGAVNIPVQSPDFAERVDDLDPNATYAVYCRSGNRSQPAVAAMHSAGIDRIYELSSGTRGWVSAGRQLVQ